MSDILKGMTLGVALILAGFAIYGNWDHIGSDPKSVTYAKPSQDMYVLFFVNTGINGQPALSMRLGEPKTSKECYDSAGFSNERLANYGETYVCRYAYTE
ncbi:hypothetical protein C8N30_2706 [Sulfitobacter guttiformis]|uniref:Uncharacterized protein n=1 Tax=Sulfitobacter guttiformis TaxID=74349 RepID=A0A420DHD1_9RHOB|nr:hypothetical protein C8N30_2706 [Sulfitobacter guttiformis]